MEAEAEEEATELQAAMGAADAGAADAAAAAADSSSNAAGAEPPAAQGDGAAAAAAEQLAAGEDAAAGPAEAGDAAASAASAEAAAAESDAGSPSEGGDADGDEAPLGGRIASLGDFENEQELDAFTENMHEMQILAEVRCSCCPSHGTSEPLTRTGGRPYATIAVLDVVADHASNPLLRRVQNGHSRCASWSTGPGHR